MNYCVIGHPIGHTLSPFIHSELFALSNIDANYTAADISPEQIGEKLEFLKSLGGFNVTIPNKSVIIPFLDKMDKTAEIFGAVNTVKNDNGVLCGYNTDGFGFTKALEAENIPLKGRVLICGYGGAALALSHEALRAGCEILVGVDDLKSEMAASFCSSLKAVYGKDIKMMLISEIDDDFDLAVNATPVGMHPKCNASILTDAQISRCGAVFDAVYNPYKTLLVQKALNLNIKAVSGMKMLVWQAAMAHTIWYGAKFTKEQIDVICQKSADKLTKEAEKQ